MKPGAFLFDLNGTMIDDMDYHVVAWSDILNNDLKAGLSTHQVHSQMYGKNSEVLTRIFGDGHFTLEEMDRLSVEKEKRYQKAYRPHLQLFAGLEDFMRKAKKEKIKMAIGSAAINFNIDFVLDNLRLRNYFNAIVSADDVLHSKPDPETYLKAAAILQTPPSQCIVFEDAPKGVEAAERAGMKTVVITSMHRADAFKEYHNIICFVADYNDGALDQLFG